MTAASSHRHALIKAVPDTFVVCLKERKLSDVVGVLVCYGKCSSSSSSPLGGGHLKDIYMCVKKGKKRCCVNVCNVINYVYSICVWCSI